MEGIPTATVPCLVTACHAVIYRIRSLGRLIKPRYQSREVPSKNRSQSMAYRRSFR